MKLIRILESENLVVDHDRERGMYRVSYFQDNHFVDEVWFDAYEEKECKFIKAMNEIEAVNAIPPADLKRMLDGKDVR